MNTIQDHKKAELEKLLDTLEFSPSNRSMALEYLSADPCDDHLLEKAEAQDFKDLDTLQQCQAAHCLSALREAGSTAQIARYIKLYWAIGKSSAIFLLEDFCDPRVREQERELRIQLLGKRAVAAMEAEHGTWGTPVWLHQLAANEPEILEDAQALGGTPPGNLHATLAGILLCERRKTVSDLPQKLPEGTDALSERQKAILTESNLNALAEAVPTLGDADRRALAGYIQKGDPDLHLPIVSVKTAYAAGPQTVLNTSLSNPYLTGLLGTASFLGQCQDDRARCAVRIYLSLNASSLLEAIFSRVPQAYLMEQLENLLWDLPGGKATMLLFLTGCSSHWISEPLRRAVAQRCKCDVDQVLQEMDAGQIMALRKLLPGTVPGGGSGQQQRIISLLEKHVQTGGPDLDAYLSDMGSLRDSAAQLSAIPASPYCFLSEEAQLICYYRIAAGWDDFACRCAVAFAVVFRGSGMEDLFRSNQDITDLAEALLAKGLPLTDTLRVFGALHDASFREAIKSSIRNAVYEAVKKPEHLTGLCTAAKTGDVFSRQVALSALDELTALPDCAQAAKAGILACAGDSSKQIRELLLTILPPHRDWASDYAALLRHGKAAERLMAAEVSAKLGDELRPALEEALAAEKSTKVVSAIRAALGQVGAAPGTPSPVNPEELTAQVLKGGKKRRVQWLLDAPLPTLHLRDHTHAQVSEDRRAALLTAYCELGRIGRSETAASLAEGIEEGDLTVLAHEVYEKWLAEGAPSKTKWVLAFAAVFGGPAMTPKLVRAISEWPQHARGAIACDAVTALALSPDPAALLAVDAISRKFKFRQVKAAAGAALEHAAQKLGITLEELADRIVPDLGFSADGKRTFDYGSRSFTVHLTPTMELEITNDAGKRVKDLPAPGKTDDAEKATAAYDDFKAMKKQLRTAASTQKNRLEAALSALRCWKDEAWQALFVKNPIMHQFAISLIWGIYENDRLQTTFRYMEDGSFNTVDEEEFCLPADARIGLVHPVELEPQVLSAWQQQLKDYEITQSILQLNRPVYRLEPGGEKRRALEDFGGKMLNGLSLSGKLQSLGWFRGSVQDGGGYYTFYREDPALGLGVELRFSGCFIGDENETVTVYDAVFYKAGTVKRGSYYYDTPKAEHIFALGDIPARYYSEVFYQLERATASSTETDPTWRERKN